MKPSSFRIDKKFLPCAWWHAATWWILFLVSAVLLIGCGSIEVNRGPFDIVVPGQQLVEKEQQLEKIRQVGFRETPPNVLLILVDDLGKHDISLYDPDGVETPHIEALAASGSTFMHAFTSSPVCSPSRAALFTGRYQQRFGFERQPMNRYSRNRIEYFFVDHFLNTEPMRLITPMADVPGEEIRKQGIPPGEILLSEILQAAGYKTGLCGKWHLGNDSMFHPNKRGFDEFYGFLEAFTLFAPEDQEGIVEHRHDYFANKHIWKQKRKGSCAIMRNDAVITEDEYLTFAIARESIGFIEQHQDRPFFLVSAFSAPHTPFQVPREYYEQLAHIKDHNKRVYYGMIAALDDAIGQLLSALETNGLKENTIIIFASDNGGATYTGATDNGPLRAGKFSQFEGGINIPMIISWPGEVPAGQQYTHQVSLLDVVPTVLEGAGLPSLGLMQLDGTNLLPFLNGITHVSHMDNPVKGPHEYLCWRTDFNKAIRTGKWKLIWNTRDKEVFLFNLEENNYEMENVAAMFPDVVEELQQVYEEWEQQMQPPLWPGVMEFKFENYGETTWWAI
ncbi:MAG: sulfatase-like hydrolase/transferase [Bacteroidales bacterium]|nr:sulfatase-like hydrolase/transferase [Bacteroidales bacterium]MDT8430364.1 sulfatase-like hydrolase/transferase [Bacteroidales bacterium]